MDCFDLNATIHLEIEGIDEAIEKTERLLSLMRELKETVTPNQ